MKIEDYEKVRRLHDEIASLDKDLAYVNGGGNGLGVTIQGRYQDDEIVDQVRPVVAGILTVAKIDRLLKLRSLGVEVGELPVEPITDWLRLDFLEGFVREAHVESCFEIDGGVHLTISRPSQSAEAYRHKDTLRDALDCAIKSACAAPSPQLPLIPGEQ